MNQNVLTPPPPRPSAGGCCGMGCATLVALIVFFAIALVGGGMWAVHHYKNEYTSAEPAAMPEDLTSDEASVVEPTDSTSPDVPVAVATPVPVKQLETQWKDFEKAGKHDEKARIILSAAQINSLLQNNKNTRGKVYVWIDSDVARVRVSVPLTNVPMMRGRYLNGEGTVKASPDGDPNKAEISSITLSDHSVPNSVMEQKFYGITSMRGVISDWLNKQNIRSFRIENNRVVAETSE